MGLLDEARATIARLRTVTAEVMVNYPLPGPRSWPQIGAAATWLLPKEAELVVAIGLFTTATMSLSIGVFAMPFVALVPCIGVAGFGFGRPPQDAIKEYF